MYPSLTAPFPAALHQETPFGERLAASQRQVLAGYCSAGQIYETHLRFLAYEMRRGHEFRKLPITAILLPPNRKNATPGGAARPAKTRTDSKIGDITDIMLSGNTAKGARPLLARFAFPSN